MLKEELKADMLVLWTNPLHPNSPLLRRVTEVRDNCAYFERGLPNGLSTCPFEHLSVVPVDYPYFKYPISKQ
jgi:hypothetical protein